MHAISSSIAGLKLVAAGIAAALLATACGGGTSISEQLSERAIEQAVRNETGEDFNIDFDGDGGFSFESEEGSFQINEDGSFTIVGEDGEVFTGETSEGGVSVQGQDGEGSFATVEGIPDEWPTDMVLPPLGLANVIGTVVVAEGQTLISVSGTAPQGAIEYFNTYGAGLETGGFERQGYFEGDDFVQGTFVGPAYTVTMVGAERDDDISVSLSSNS